VRGCVFHVATRQICIHDAEDVDFYVHAMSRPIIDALATVDMYAAW
jgi:hypothetical protein